MRLSSLFIALALAGASLTATAGTRSASAEPVVIRDVPAFLEYQRDVRADVRKGSKYKHVDNASKAELMRAQDELFAILEGKRSIEELSDEDRLAVYNAQTKVAAVLNDAELDRPMCKREKRLGSNMAQTVCTTKREREDKAKHGQDLMRYGRNCAPGAETCGEIRGGS